MSNATEKATTISQSKVSQLVLTFQHDTFNCQISGTVENLDVALAMLDMARREVEAQLRAAKASRLVSAPAGVALPFMRRGN